MLQAQWFRIGPDTGAREVIHEIEEPLEAGMTYSAEYTFGKGAGNDKVEPTAAPIEPTPVPTLEPSEQGTAEVGGATAVTEIQPEPTKEVTDGMGESGAGGLAASCPLAAGYAVLRRR